MEQHILVSDVEFLHFKSENDIYVISVPFKLLLIVSIEYPYLRLVMKQDVRMTWLGHTMLMLYGELTCPQIYEIRVDPEHCLSDVLRRVIYSLTHGHDVSHRDEPLRLCTKHLL